jgi:hypothetical protein
VVQSRFGCAVQYFIFYDAAQSQNTFAKQTHWNKNIKPKNHNFQHKKANNQPILVRDETNTSDKTCNYSMLCKKN